MKPTKARPAAAFEEFEASSLYCDRCRAALPVRQRLLLVLPDGDLYEYRCSRCNQPVGKKKDQGSSFGRVLLDPGSVSGGS
jgi:hypothetical protein